MMKVKKVRRWLNENPNKEVYIGIKIIDDLVFLEIDRIPINSVLSGLGKNKKVNAAITDLGLIIIDITYIMPSMRK